MSRALIYLFLRTFWASSWSPLTGWTNETNKCTLKSVFVHLPKISFRVTIREQESLRGTMIYVPAAPGLLSKGPQSVNKHFEKKKGRSILKKDKVIKSYANPTCRKIHRCRKLFLARTGRGVADERFFRTATRGGSLIFKSIMYMPL